MEWLSESFDEVEEADEALSSQRERALAINIITWCPCLQPTTSALNAVKPTFGANMPLYVGARLICTCTQRRMTQSFMYACATVFLQVRCGSICMSVHVSLFRCCRMQVNWFYSTCIRFKCSTIRVLSQSRAYVLQPVRSTKDDMRHILFFVYIYAAVARSPAIDVSCILDRWRLSYGNYHSASSNLDIYSLSLPANSRPL